MTESRVKSIALCFPEAKRTLHANLLWDFNPAVCDLLVSGLPVSTMYSHTMASGKGLYAPMPIVGRVESKRALLSELPLGTVTFNTENYKTLSIFYGEVTEPLPTTPVAKVIDGDLDAMREIGDFVWYANFARRCGVLVEVTAEDASAR